ncbi:MAG: hypothetical protein SVR08_07400 [Spirochaetota bacterium]|nr:hypothetical protein [Spirochaetota bacterium]
MDKSISNNLNLIKKGEILLVQGTVPKFLHLLQSGSLEILSAPQEYEGLDADIITSKSKRVGVIKEKTIISGLNIVFSGPSKKSIRAIEDSRVEKYPIKQGGLKQIINANPNLSISLLSHLFKILDSSLSDALKYIKLFENLCKINDNISLIFKSLSTNITSDKLQDKSEHLYKTFTSNGGELPPIFDAKFVISDNSAQLNKKYSFPSLPLETLIDIKQCKFIRKLLKLKSNTFLMIAKEDPSISESMYESLSENLIKVLDRIEAIQYEIENELTTLFGSENSWALYLTEGGGLSEWQKSGGLSPNFANNFSSLITKLISHCSVLFTENPEKVYPGFNQIKNYQLSNNIDQEEEKINRDNNKETSSKKQIGVERLYKNSFDQIMEFALIDKEFQRKFHKDITDFKNMQNPFSSDPDCRKKRQKIAKQYWEIFGQVYTRSQIESSSPPPIRLMMRFGFVDEELLEDSQISELHEIITHKEEVKIPIYFEDEFLNSIYTGKNNPSITEMGLSYKAFLREQEKYRKKEKKSSKIDINDENIKKTIYEIDHRLLTTVAVCSGSTATAFPILNKSVLRGKVSNLYISKKKLESIINSLKDIDYSVFYRETVVKLDEAREIIQTEIIPNFILLPSLGSKIMLWQELDGSNRKTRGRIVVPILCLGDIQKSLAHTFACFRWELNRTIKGAMWADPVEGGITGIYFDYVNFYKKNSKLSAETKNKITEKFKSLRTNRDRFADDYIMWVLYEKECVMRLNNVTREMFYRYIPFKEDIRAKLENMPAFSEIASKFKNIQNKTITGYERRFKKYVDETGNLPPKLQEFIDFLNQ